MLVDDDPPEGMAVRARRRYVSADEDSGNIDSGRLHQLTGTEQSATSASRPPLLKWLAAWSDHDADPREGLDSLPGVLWHLSDAWARRMGRQR